MFCSASNNATIALKYCMIASSLAVVDSVCVPRVILPIYDALPKILEISSGSGSFRNASVVTKTKFFTNYKASSSDM